MTYHRVCNLTRLTRRVSLVEQELLKPPEHLSSPPVFSGVRVSRSLALCVCFVDRCLSFLFWPLCFLFFDLRILITPLVFSNSSSYATYYNKRIKRQALHCDSFSSLF